MGIKNGVLEIFLWGRPGGGLGVECVITRAVIDIGDIDVLIKMSFDIDINIENVDIDILELVVTTVLELASLKTNTLKSINHSEIM